MKYENKYEVPSPARRGGQFAQERVTTEPSC